MATKCSNNVKCYCDVMKVISRLGALLCLDLAMISDQPREIDAVFQVANTFALLHFGLGPVSMGHEFDPSLVPYFRGVGS